jgi:NAD(P) transhydrogenase
MVGGMMVMNGGYLPANFSGCLAAASVAIASLNVFGGFLVTQRMLKMFRRPGDPVEHNYLMGVAALVGALGYMGGVKAGVPVP